MTRLNLSLLGQLHIQLDGRTFDDLGYDKVRALLVYLAVEADRLHRREALAALLWPDQPEAEARHGLRQALATLRKAIDGDAPPSLLISRETIGFNRDSDSWLDVSAFTALLDACDRHPHQQPAMCARCAQRIEEAATLYRGDFLAGSALAASVEFEEWMLLQRQRLQQRLRDALAHLAVFHEQRGDYGRARDVVQRQLALDPWLESAHRQLMRVLWLSGDRSAALAQYDRCRQLLSDELGVEPEPATAALDAEIRAAPAPIAVPKVAVSERGRLPEPLTPFVGRARELEAIAARLTDPRCRLLSLVGPGGIGKTRLAIRAAREHATAFADGAAFVTLAPVSSPELLGPAIADALGIPLSDHQRPQAQLLDRLRQREQLLVLDNFEHLLTGAPLISEILGAAPGLKVLVTSRERLNLHGEWVFEVSGLGVPTDAGGFEGYDAVELFMQHLRRVRTNMSLSAVERPWVVRICRWVEGMPLALELAAAWATTLTLPEIMQEMEQSLGFLTTSLRDVPPRHLSMRAVFDVSWNLLTEGERAVFRRLSIFRGGFRRPAAEELADASLPILAALVSKSFLRASADGRYSMHELLRQYGAEQLALDPEQRALHDRHCAYYLDFLAERETALAGQDQGAALAEIDAEIGNVREAWRWAVAEARASEIARAIRALWLFYATRGRMWEGTQEIGRAVTALEGADDAGADQPERALALGQALAHQGSALCRLGRYEDAALRFARGVALLRGLNAPRQLGLALNLHAMIAHAQGKYAVEAAILQESRNLLLAAGDAWGAAYSLNDLALVAHLRGDDIAARQLCQDSVTIFARCGDRRGQAFVHHNLGRIAADTGAYDEATRHHQTSLTFRREMDDQWGIASSLIQLGTVAGLTGARDPAEHYLLDALRTAIDSRLQPVALDALVELATLPRVSNVSPSDLLTAVLHHPACSQATRDKAAKLLMATSPPERVPGAGVPGEIDPERAVQALAAMLLRQQAPRSPSDDLELDSPA